MPATPPRGPSALEKGNVAEAAHDIVTLVTSGGALRLARIDLDDHEADRVVYVLSQMDECIFVNPKGARAVQRGASYEFSVRLRRLPEDPSRYFVTLFPLLDVCPWMGPEAWVIPGPELVRGADRSKPRIVRLPVEPDPRNRFEKYRRPRGVVADDYLAALESETARPRRRGAPTFSEAAQAMILERALYCHLTMGSGGALKVWQPYSDVQGLDQAVNFAGQPTFLGLQPKGALARDADGLLQVHIPRSTFHPSPFNFIVILEFVPADLALGEFMWFIPTEVLKERVEQSGGTLVFRVSPRRNSTKDNFLPWRFKTGELPGVVATALAGLARRWETLPATAEEVRRAQRELLGPRGARAGAAGIEALRRASLR